MDNEKGRMLSGTGRLRTMADEREKAREAGAAQLFSSMETTTTQQGWPDCSSFVT
jgi:hypothetical protein